MNKFFSISLLAIFLITKAFSQTDCAKVYFSNTSNEIKPYDASSNTVGPTTFVAPFTVSSLAINPVNSTIVAIATTTNTTVDVYVYDPLTTTGITYTGVAPNPGNDAYNRFAFVPSSQIAYLFNLKNNKFVQLDFSGGSPTIATLTAIGAPPITGNDYIGGDIVMKTATQGYLLTSGFATGLKYFYSFVISGSTVTFTLKGSTTTTGSCSSLAFDPAGSGDLYFNAGLNFYSFPTSSAGTFTTTLLYSSFTSVTPTDFASNEPPTAAVAAGSQTVCNSSSAFIISGNTPTRGVVNWSLLSGTGTITGATTTTSTTVSVTPGNTATFQYQIKNCATSTSTVTIKNDALPTTANAGATASVCTNSYTTAANAPTVGTGFWSLTSGSGTIANTASPATLITGLAFGTNTFKWAITSGACPSSSSTLTINVINCPPVAVNDNFSTPFNTTLNQTVATNDSDPNVGQTLIYTILSSVPVSAGTVTMNSNGTFVYTPTNGFTGTTSFTYQACDNLGLCTTATVTINVGVSNADHDNDGIPDATDIDDDNDGIVDTAEGNGDTDGDGVPNLFDLDSDNDGIFDVVENAGSDPDNDGIVGTGSITVAANGLPTSLAGTPLPLVDTDNDGKPNSLDLDADNDGIFDVVENGKAALDTDNNGTINGIDVDGDGIINVTGVDTNATLGGTGTAPLNFDGDSKPNYLDLDADNDGITDVKETGNVALDADNNGVIDGTDTDGDGIINNVAIDPNTTFGGISATPINTDNVGNTNYLDIDADNDGIVDNIEAQTTTSYIAPSGIDTDKDGIDNAYDTFNGFGGAGITPTNTDGADNPDYTDLDTDNDGNIDAIEGWDLNGNDVLGAGETTASGLDADSDGLDDAYDTNDALINPSNGQIPTSFPNVENGTAELDWRDPKIMAADHDKDGIPYLTDIDDDNDGILDTAEGNADNDGDGVPNSFDLDSDNDGIFDVIENGGSDTDNNGIAGTGVITVDANGLPNSLAGIPTPLIDTDNDGKPNSLDLDSDNDGITDVKETGNPSLDTNNNGVIDGIDTDGDGIINNSTIDPNNILGGTGFVLINTDNAGNPNYLDIDADNDGIVDNIEAQTTTGYIAPSGIDADGDGIDNAYDNFNGFGGAGITPTNTDGADNPDYTDLDTDNDGNIDAIEGWDLNGNDIIGAGEISPSGTDADNDGLDDAYDSNDVLINPSNGQTPTSFPNVEAGTVQPDWRDTEPSTDHDHDGIPDLIDIDDDNDGITDVQECATSLNFCDTDGDGISDIYDLDSDNDGISDVIEAGGTDPNNDGIIGSGTFIDTDNDGLADMVDNATSDGLQPKDFDKDGHPDFQDLDSDNDGINDLTEAGNPLVTDANSNGVVDGLDADGDGLPNSIDNNSGGALSIPIDFDKDTHPDYNDLDSDNDGINDIAESGEPVTDANNDGIVDGPDSDGDGINDSADANDTVVGDPNINDIPRDFDKDGKPDYHDLDSDGDGLTDVLESGNITLDKDTNGIIDGVDSDNDGIVDAVDASPAYGDALDANTLPDTDNDGKFDYLDLDSDNDGVLDNTEDELPNEDCDSDGVSNLLDKDPCPLFVPQGFSPNGDGVNDNLVIKGIAYYPNNTIKLFNRWGNLVYSAINYQNDWNGTTNKGFSIGGSDLPIGTYFYILDLGIQGKILKGYIYINK